MKNLNTARASLPVLPILAPSKAMNELSSLLRAAGIEHRSHSRSIVAIVNGAEVEFDRHGQLVSISRTVAAKAA
jgi:hypothetical protein